MIVGTVEVSGDKTVFNRTKTAQPEEEEEPGGEMDLMPRSYQIIRQYPQLSRHLNLSYDNEADREEESEGEDSTEDSPPLPLTADNKTAFVRQGFGRLSTVSGASVGGAAAENFNSVDEITIYGNIRKRCPAR